VVASDRELVLLVAADLPLAGREGRVLAHGQPGARLGVAGGLRHDLRRPQAAGEADPLACTPRPPHAQEDPAQVVVHGDRGVADRVDTSGDPALDLAGRNPARDPDGGLQPRRTSLLQVLRRRPRRQAASEHALAGQVEVAGVLQDRSGDDLPDGLALEAEAGDEPVECRGQHVLVAGPGVRAVRAGEGDPVAPDDDGVSHCHLGCAR
jgi:hypothetical protein